METFLAALAVLITTVIFRNWIAVLFGAVVGFTIVNAAFGLIVGILLWLILVFEPTKESNSNDKTK
jgi:hypothetical protein